METPSKESQLLMALKAIENDPQMSARRAAAIYGVSDRTLYRCQSGIPSRRDSPPNSKKLTESEEQVLVQYIFDLDSQFFAPRICGVEEMANILLAERDAGCIGINWTRIFIKR
jgi:hypothetical protein